MYESHWQLQRKPFETCADPRFYYPSDSHQAALLKLRYVVENQRGAAVLGGAAGLGKTLILAMLKQALGETFQPLVHLVFPQMPAAELVAYLAAELTGSSLGASLPPLAASVRQIEQFLGENAARKRQAVAIIDEAHLIDEPSTWESLRLLLNFQPQGQCGLTLLLAGQTGVLPTLDHMPHFEERLAVKCLVRPFAAHDTAAYVVHRLKTAGSEREIFDADALTAVHELTHGVPRRINRLCDLALLIGYAEGLQGVTAAHLESVSQELVAATAD